jgi:hypothetical protein
MEIDVVQDEDAVPTPATGKIELYMLEKAVPGPSAGFAPGPDRTILTLRCKCDDGSKHTLAAMRSEPGGALVPQPPE